MGPSGSLLLACWSTYAQPNSRAPPTSPLFFLQALQSLPDDAVAGLLEERMGDLTAKLADMSVAMRAMAGRKADQVRREGAGTRE